jgi:hypothetical protein
MLDHGAPTLRMMTAWSSAMTDCATTGARLWWGTANQMSEAMSGQMRVAAATLAPPQRHTKSWYRAPDFASRETTPYEMLARFLTPMGQPSSAGAQSFFAGPALPWLPAGMSAWSTAPYGVHHKVWSDAAMLTMRNPFVAAWMEGASRAFLPPALAGLSDIARRPSSGIPYVSYRSDSGHAVAQIAYATTSAMIAAGPAVIAWVDAVTPAASRPFRV